MPFLCRDAAGGRGAPFPHVILGQRARMLFPGMSSWAGPPGARLAGSLPYFFFSAFHTVREIALPQKGQKFTQYRFGRSSGEPTA